MPANALRMTDWERVEELRSRGVSWDKVAGDRKARFHPPPGANPGRALRALYSQRRSRKGGVSTGARRALAERGLQVDERGPWRWRSILVGSVVLVVFLLVVYFVLASGFLLGGPPKLGTDPGPSAAGSVPEFNYLSQQKTDACHWDGVSLGDETGYINWITGQADNTYIQGSCCTPMDYSPDYASQIPGLTSYASNSLVPSDPYNVPAHIAKADVANVDLGLTSSQLSIFNTASSNAADHGWCCCACWAYYAHEGLAKALIVQDGYDASQVDSVINLEDCCGGPGAMSM